MSFKSWLIAFLVLVGSVPAAQAQITNCASPNYYVQQFHPGCLSWTDLNNAFSSPPRIGSATPSTGRFSDLTVLGTFTSSGAFNFNGIVGGNPTFTGTPVFALGPTFNAAITVPGIKSTGTADFLFGTTKGVRFENGFGGNDGPALVSTAQKNIFIESPLQVQALTSSPAGTWDFRVYGYGGNTVTLSGAQEYNTIRSTATVAGSTTKGPDHWATHLFATNYNALTTTHTALTAEIQALVNTNTNGAVGALNANVTIAGTGITNGYYVAGNFWVDGQANVGGTGTTGTSAIGNAFAMNPQVVLRAGASYWQTINGSEVDVLVQATYRDATISGTATNGDTIQLTFTSGIISGSPVTVTANVGTSNSTGTVANKLMAAINGNTALRNAGIGGLILPIGSSVVRITWPFPQSVTVAATVTGSATETVTLGSVVQGASAAQKYGTSFIRLEGDSAQGVQSGADVAILMGAQSVQPAGGWRAMMQVGSNVDVWPFAYDGVLFQTIQPTAIYNLPRPQQLLPQRLKGGFDLHLINFSQDSTGGYPHWTPNWKLNGVGAHAMGPAIVSPASTGLNIDSAGQVGTTIAIASGGGGGSGVSTSNYYVGDSLTDAYGGQYHVTVVDAVTGAITTLATDVSPSITSGAAPGNPVSLAGGSGTGATINITWSAATTLNLQPTAGGRISMSDATGRLGFYGTTPIVKATPVGACAGNTGCQALRDALGNLGLINTGSISN